MRQNDESYLGLLGPPIRARFPDKRHFRGEESQEYTYARMTLTQDIKSKQECRNAKEEAREKIYDIAGREICGEKFKIVG